MKHVLTHQVIRASFFYIQTENYTALNALRKEMKIPPDIVTINTLRHYPVSRLMEKFFEKNPLSNW
jgi:hypothetical protein